MINWPRLSKLAGMLGSPHDGERLNAARLLERALIFEGASFADLARRIEEGGTPRNVVLVEKRPKPNPAANTARKILERTNDGARLTMNERMFLRGIVRNDEMTDGDYKLTSQQANWLTMLENTWTKPRMPVVKAKPPKPVPQSMLNEIGLGEPPKRRRTHTKPREPLMPDAREESFAKHDQQAWSRRELDLDEPPF